MILSCADVAAESARGARRCSSRSRLAGGYRYLRRSLPEIDGTITRRRPVGAGRHRPRRRRHPAHLRRDQARRAVRPRLRRTRRIGCGRWSSSAASATAGCRRSSARATLPQDRFLRTVGFGRAARAAWDATPDWAKQQINAYVAGVNAFIATHHGSRAAARVHAAPLRARAVDRRRRASSG